MSRKTARLAVALATSAFLALAGAAAMAEDVKLGSLTISSAWTRATPPKAPTAGGYLTITNAGPEADRLIAAASPIAGKADLHQMAMKNGVMTMRPVTGGIEIPAGGKVSLSPDGFHIMFTALKQSLKKGESVPVTLTFEKAGKADITLSVEAVGAKGPAGAAGGMDMGGMKM